MKNSDKQIFINGIEHVVGMQRIINRLAVIIIDNNSTLYLIFNKIIKSTTPSVIEEITLIHSYLTEQAPLFVTIRLYESNTFIENYKLCLEFHSNLMKMYNIYHNWVNTLDDATIDAEFKSDRFKLIDNIGLLLELFTTFAKRMSTLISSARTSSAHTSSARTSGGRNNRRTTCAKKARKVRTTRSRK